MLPPLPCLACRFKGRELRGYGGDHEPSPESRELPPNGNERGLVSPLAGDKPLGQAEVVVVDGVEDATAYVWRVALLKCLLQSGAEGANSLEASLGHGFEIEDVQNVDCVLTS